MIDSGSIGPLGKPLEPYGAISENEAEELFRRALRLEPNNAYIVNFFADFTVEVSTPEDIMGHTNDMKALIIDDEPAIRELAASSDSAGQARAMNRDFRSLISAVAGPASVRMLSGGSWGSGWLG